MVLAGKGAAGSRWSPVRWRRAEAEPRLPWSRAWFPARDQATSPAPHAAPQRLQSSRSLQGVRSAPQQALGGLALRGPGCPAATAHEDQLSQDAARACAQQVPRPLWQDPPSSLTWVAAAVAASRHQPPHPGPNPTELRGHRGVPIRWYEVPSPQGHRKRKKDVWVVGLIYMDMNLP